VRVGKSRHVRVGRSKHPRVGSGRGQTRMTAVSARTPTWPGRAKQRPHVHTQTRGQYRVTGVCAGFLGGTVSLAVPTGPTWPSGPSIRRVSLPTWSGIRSECCSLMRKSKADAPMLWIGAFVSPSPSGAASPNHHPTARSERLRRFPLCAQDRYSLNVSEPV
jgi:hypothetical protein